jgi:hypothetical protein
MQKMEQTVSQSVDNEHSGFDHEKDASAIVQNMRFYVWSEFFFSSLSVHIIYF